MGGDVLVGIRRRSGEVYLAERHTNPTPYWFNDPAFYDADEQQVQQYIEEGAEGCLRDCITPSEYGVILVDLINRSVLSRQDYTSIGRLHTNFDNCEKLELIKKHQQLGTIDQISLQLRRGQTTPIWGEPDSNGLIILDDRAQQLYWQQLDSVLAATETWKQLKRNDPPPSLLLMENHFFEVSWRIPDLEVSDIVGGRGYDNWSDVLGWVQRMGWSSPCWSEQQVTAYLQQLSG